METNIFDPDYVQKQQVANLQRMAAEQNTMRVQGYVGASAQWVTTNMRNRDIGLPISDPPKIPKKITVGDDGQWTESLFTDLLAPVLPPVVAPAGGTSAIRATSNVPPDRLDQVLAILRVFNDKLDAIARKVGA